MCSVVWVLAQSVVVESGCRARERLNFWGAGEVVKGLRAACR